MKIFKKVAMLMVVIALMTGCAMKETVTMNVSADKKVKVSIITAMDNEMIDTMISMNGEAGTDSTEGKTYTDAERWAYLESDDSSINVEEGYVTEKYDKDGFKGYLAAKELGSLDEISAESATDRVNILDSSDSENSKILEGVLFIKNGNSYKSNMKVDLGDSSEQMASYQSYGAIFNVEFVVELPVKPTSNNATKVSEDGKTLTYDLLKTKDIDFEFDMSGVKESGSLISLDSNLKLYICIGAGVLLIILIIIIASRKKKTPVQYDMPATPVQPVGPVQPTEPVQPVEPVQPAEPIQPVEPVQPIEPVQPTVSVEPVEPVPIVEPVQSIPTIEPVEPVVPVEPIQPIEPVQEIQPEGQNDINSPM